MEDINWLEIEKRNREKKERQEADRKLKNEEVKKDYRLIPPRKPTPPRGSNGNGGGAPSSLHY